LPEITKPLLSSIGKVNQKGD